MPRKKAQPQWDVFIAHASAEKEALVRPLASFLQHRGLRVWFDEFELRVGDSISETVDRGLALSRFGVVVLSRDFFSRSWPQHELRGLVAVALSESGSGRVLPIWYGLTREEVGEFSPTLADRWALKGDNTDVPTLGLGILRVVRPDLYAQLLRRAILGKLVATAKPTMAKVEDLKPGPIRHATLPPALVRRIRLIHAVFSDVLRSSVDRTIENFRRDIQPELEVEAWEELSAAYLLALKGRKPTLAYRAKVFEFLMRAQAGPLGIRSAKSVSGITPTDGRRLLRILRDQRRRPKS
jgi:hypothetical protein